VHPKLAAAYAVLPEPLDDAEALRLATLRGLLYGYHHRWLQETWTVETVEEEFHLPILNPATKRRSRTFAHAGKFDGVIANGAERYLLEHKSCSEDLDDGGPYWKRLTIDTQISAYLLAAHVAGHTLAGVVYDVIRKPEIRPKKLPRAEKNEVEKTGTYCGVQLSTEELLRWSRDAELRETPVMYEARLCRDTVTRPAWYFARRIVRRLDQELLAYAQELWQTAEEIRFAHKRGDIRRNDRACMAYGRPCEYLDLCAGHDTVLSPTWKKLPTIHPELEDTSNGDHLLTHTRISTFTACRRKHFYRYTLGIARWEEAEALTFGRLLHAALAAWWTAASGECASPPTDAHDRDDAGENPSQSRASARGPGLGKDEPRGPGTRPGVPHDEERNRARDADPERSAPADAVDAVSAV